MSIKLTVPSKGETQAETVENLYNAQIKLVKELEFYLNNKETPTLSTVLASINS